MSWRNRLSWQWIIRGTCLGLLGLCAGLWGLSYFYVPADQAAELVRLGFGQLDALHIASAESADCGVMLTTDDRLLKKAGRNAKALKVRVENPLQWLLEQDDDTNDPR